MHSTLCVTLPMHVDRDDGSDGVLSAERVTAPLLTMPAVGHPLGVLRSVAPGAHLTLLVKQVRQRRRFEPGIRVTADPFGRERQDIAVEVAHERADSHVQLGGVATLFHKDHEHGTQEARTALVHAVLLLRVPGLRRQQLRFLQQGVQPTIRQVLG
jgi:hypothetical protein